MEQSPDTISDAAAVEESERIRRTAQELRRCAVRESARRLLDEPDDVAARVVEKLPSPQALAVLELLASKGRDAIRPVASAAKREQWEQNEAYPNETLGRLMDLPAGTFAPETTVAEAIEGLREAVRRRFITYLYVVDPDERLIGLVVMRDLLLAERDQTLDDLMIREPFFLEPETTLEKAAKKAVSKSYPVYPVCNSDGKLVGLVRGEELFEQNMVRVVVQAGSMVGVEKEERVTTSFWRSLRMRHPWLQLNLITALAAGAVVGVFEGTIEQIVVLAAFVPVMAGQSGNTGAQSMAVTLRGMTLGDFADKKPLEVVSQEARLGLVNGVLVGSISGLLMFFYALGNDADSPATLGLIVLISMASSCLLSGIFGTLVPIGLKKLGADPATASAILLSTATDVFSIALLLGLATLMVL
jgi:magnesium transporter